VATCFGLIQSETCSPYRNTICCVWLRIGLFSFTGFRTQRGLFY